MKPKSVDTLVDSCAKVACLGKQITSYVIVYATRDGNLHCHRDGRFPEQYGLIKYVDRALGSALDSSRSYQMDEEQE